MLALHQYHSLSVCLSHHTQHQSLSAQRCRIRPRASRRIVRRRRISKLPRPMLAPTKINQTHTHLSNLPRYTRFRQWMMRRMTKHLLPSHSLCRESMTHSSLCQWHCPLLFRMIRFCQTPSASPTRRPSPQQKLRQSPSQKKHHLSKQSTPTYASTPLPPPMPCHLCHPKSQPHALQLRLAIHQLKRLLPVLSHHSPRHLQSNPPRQLPLIIRKSPHPILPSSQHLLSNHPLRQLSLRRLLHPHQPQCPTGIARH